MASATQFKVGESKGWTVPEDPNFYSQWAESNRFQIGDSLLFVYPQGQDSVLLVKQEDYNTCNTSSFIEAYRDGNTVFTLSSSGPFYFISGNQENCLKHESLVVVVMGEKSNATAPSLPPSPSMASPPPPPESIIGTPITSPSVETISPPSAGSTMVMSLMTSVGALIGSLLYVL
ncbi:hypothetical protein J5N97_027255 [Dioscorea zingiberensis]|uniref:Phytocyanin domain-containing protein n=1 Tax=Dioscorea zingiberensis TaxID=325984 RepID=A0A9D5C4W0_9LILI|nr:hypothetical protein J5N97_027255 [Dioscorea zingiberensis]